MSRKKGDTMDSVYLYDGPFDRGEAGWPLIREAAARYGAEQGLDYDFYQGELLRDDWGKPYFVGSGDGVSGISRPVDFSLSHSGSLWMCLFSRQPCGLDLQEYKECRFEEIAGRQFTEAEQHYVQLWGLDGFFAVWVRKEAFGKCTGSGIFGEMPSVAADGALLDQVSHEGKTYYFTEIAIAPDLPCVACAEKPLEIEMRILG